MEPNDRSHADTTRKYETLATILNPGTLTANPLLILSGVDDRPKSKTGVEDTSLTRKSFRYARSGLRGHGEGGPPWEIGNPPWRGEPPPWMKSKSSRPDMISSVTSVGSTDSSSSRELSNSDATRATTSQVSSSITEPTVTSPINTTDIPGPPELQPYINNLPTSTSAQMNVFSLASSSSISMTSSSKSTADNSLATQSTLSSVFVASRPRSTIQSIEPAAGGIRSSTRSVDTAKLTATDITPSASLVQQTTQPLQSAILVGQTSYGNFLSSDTTTSSPLSQASSTRNAKTSQTPSTSVPVSLAIPSNAATSTPSNNNVSPANTLVLATSIGTASTDSTSASTSDSEHETITYATTMFMTTTLPKSSTILTSTPTISPVLALTTHTTSEPLTTTTTTTAVTSSTPSPSTTTPLSSSPSPSSHAHPSLLFLLLLLLLLALPPLLALFLFSLRHISPTLYTRLTPYCPLRTLHNLLTSISARLKATRRRNRAVRARERGYIRSTSTTKSVLGRESEDAWVRKWALERAAEAAAAAAEKEEGERGGEKSRFGQWRWAGDTMPHGVT